MLPRITRFSSKFIAISHIFYAKFSSLENKYRMEKSLCKVAKF